jgi:hypothetical protein
MDDYSTVLDQIGRIDQLLDRIIGDQEPKTGLRNFYGNIDDCCETDNEENYEE